MKVGTRVKTWDGRFGVVAAIRIDNIEVKIDSGNTLYCGEKDITKVPTAEELVLDVDDDDDDDDTDIFEFVRITPKEEEKESTESV